MMMPSPIYGRTYPIRYSSTHTRNHGNASAITPSDHLLRNRLSCHENACDVNLRCVSLYLGPTGRDISHLEHCVRIFL